MQLEGDLPQPESGEEAVGQGDDLDIEVGVGGTERLDTELVMLPVPALLGVLVAERRRHVPGLPGRDGVVLHEGAGNGRVPSGRNAIIWPSRSSKMYISLPTTSLASPMPRRKTPACSMIGVRVRP